MKQPIDTYSGILRLLRSARNAEEIERDLQEAAAHALRYNWPLRWCVDVQHAAARRQRELDEIARRLDEPPIVQGGQGRDARATIESARVVGLTLLGVALLTLTLVIVWIMGGLS